MPVSTTSSRRSPVPSSPAVLPALPALPAYVDDPQYPAFVVDQPLGLLVAATGAVAALLLGAVAGTAAVLTRSASVTRLREAEQ